jgi:glycosyltransferase involved in cell wall biosynthesis
MGAPLHDTLSIIVPVRDAEATLTADLGRLLELLPDLTHRFEIVVVDDGSTDHTVELVRDLAAEFPQLRLIRHPQPQGRDAAVKTGLQWAAGKTVFVQEDAVVPSAADLRRLWMLRQDEAVVMARATRQPPAFEAGLLDRLSAWGQTLRNLASGRPAGGIQMIRRDGALQLADHDDLAVAELSATESHRADHAHPTPRAEASRQSLTFLKHLRDLALGE